MRVHAPDLILKRKRNEKIVMLTAYDYTSAKIIDAAGVDAILVGDSLGSVIQGHETTLSVSLEEMIYHSAMVSRASKNSLVIADLPFLTYQLSPEQALDTAGTLVKEAGVGAVKLEGGYPSLEAVSRIVEAGIPVLGHVGLCPQHFHKIGGYRVQGRSADEAQEILETAKAIEAAGAFGVVLEAVPPKLAQGVTEALTIPTIGIGAGGGCSGQVLVFQDLIGFSESSPKFVRRYAEVREVINQAVSSYVTDVKEGKFPAPEHEYQE